MATTPRIKTDKETENILKAQEKIEVYVAPNGTDNSPIPVCINGCITLVPVGQRVLVASSIAERLQHIDRLNKSSRLLLSQYTEV